MPRARRGRPTASRRRAAAEQATGGSHAAGGRVSKAPHPPEPTAGDCTASYWGGNPKPPAAVRQLAASDAAIDDKNESTETQVVHRRGGGLPSSLAAPVPTYGCVGTPTMYRPTGPCWDQDALPIVAGLRVDVHTRTFISMRAFEAGDAVLPEYAYV